MNRSMVVLVLLSLLLAVTLCHAEENKTEYTVSVDTTKINLGGQVDQVAEALKKHMEGPMGMYYHAAVKKTELTAGITVAIGLLLLSSSILIAFWRPGDGGNYVYGGFGIVLAIVITAVAMPPLLCPEYYAMNDILTKLGSMVN